jgi:hypothetical protein
MSHKLNVFLYARKVQFKSPELHMIMHVRKITCWTLQHASGFHLWTNVSPLCSKINYVFKNQISVKKIEKEILSKSYGRIIELTLRYKKGDEYFFTLNFMFIVEQNILLTTISSVSFVSKSEKIDLFGCGNVCHTKMFNF